jgi:glycosyltransferase involved in cell wall biosynthesis
VVPNWVDVGKFAYRPHGQHQPVHVGLLGQISPHKGHDDAVEAIRRLGNGFRLLIAGKGEADYVAALKQKSVGLPVDFMGFVSLPEFFALVDVMIVPSWEEPFGIVLLEAMASGIPVVATGCGGPADILTSGRDGLLVPPRDPAALAEAVRRIADDRGIYEAIVRQARNRVETHYDIGKVVPRIEEFYCLKVIRS